jgi:HlyD family secretion protein
MKSSTQLHCASIGALLTFALVGCHSSGGNAGDAAADAPRSVFVAAVAERTIDDALKVNGPLIAREEAAVAPQLSGYQISRVLVDVGDYVKAGQVLAVLDDTLLKSDIAQQKANVTQAEVAAEQASQQAARVAGLDNSGVLSAEALSERRLASRTARAQLAQARALLTGQQVREGLMVVRAPVSGRILERTARPGDVASPSSPLFRIARDGSVEVNAEVPENGLQLVSLGDAADVILADGTHTAGRVRLIGGEIDPQTRLGHVRISLPPRSDLRVGGFAEVRLRPRSVPVRTVPESAVQYSASGASVMTLDAHNVVAAKPVTVGRRGGGLVELVQGPPANTRVLVGSQSFVLDGDRVRPMRAPASGAR